MADVCPVPHLLRNYEPRDRPFVCQTWVRSLADAPAYLGWPVTDYFRTMQARVDALVDDIKRNQIIMATAPDDTDGFLGFVCRSRENHGIVHMVYVKGPYRRMGLARRLVNYQRNTTLPILGTHWGLHCEAIAVNSHGRMVYCPSLLKEARRSRMKPSTPTVVVKGQLHVPTPQKVE